MTIKVKMTKTEEVFFAFSQYFEDNSFDVMYLGDDAFPVPFFTQETINNLCKGVSRVMEKESTLLNLTGSYTIVGDIHGSIRDLIYIFKKYGTPETTKYIFLGNYVDRGEFSFEVISLLFAAKIMFPDNVYLLRGSHEFKDVNERCGLRDEAMSNYSMSLYEIVNVAFCYMPLACILNNATFLVHSGISDGLILACDINNIKRPSSDFVGAYGNAVSDLMWSVPSTKVKEFGDSSRPGIHAFGETAVDEFFSRNKLKRIIRSNTCVMNGVESLFDGKVVTVFSASNYRNGVANKLGVAFVKRDNSLDTFEDDPIEKLSRATATMRLNGSIASSTKLSVSKKAKNRMRRFSVSVLPDFNVGSSFVSSKLCSSASPKALGRAAATQSMCNAGTFFDIMSSFH